MYVVSSLFDVVDRDLRSFSEVEMLLESFSKQVEEIVNEVDTLVVSSRRFYCCRTLDHVFASGKRSSNARRHRIDPRF